MSRVRALIEALDRVGDYKVFARHSEQYGDDLARMWAEVLAGSWLLWLAACVGVDRRRVVGAARACLTPALVYLGEHAADAQAVLRAAEAWERGEGTARACEEASWQAYDWIARPSDLLSEAGANVMDATVWLSYVIARIPEPLRGDDGDALARARAECAQSVGAALDRVAEAYAHARGEAAPSPGPSPSSLLASARQREESRRLADVVRVHISFDEVLAAARKNGLWEG